MFKQILVPVDGTPRGEESLSIALQLARDSRARVVLLRAEPEGASPDEVTSDEESLRRLVEQIREAGITSYAILEHDKPVEAIVEAVRTQQSDVIIMAPRRRGPIDGVIHPSVTEKMLARSPAPLFIWPEGSAGAEPGQFLRTVDSLVIVPLDGSELAERALPTAVQLAEEYDRTLLLVRVVQAPIVMDTGPETVPLAAAARHEAESDALHYLRRMRRHVAREFGVPTQTTLLIGDPGDQLVAYAASHPNSVIVMTTHGRTGLAKLFAGSVAAAVIKRSTVPVVVMAALQPPAEPSSATGMESTYPAHG